MKKFIKKTVLFSLALWLLLLSALMALNAVADARFNYNLGRDTNTLILGDSHTLCALDDKLIPNAVNLSESADPYFFSYVKAERFINASPEIKTIVLGYAPHNLTTEQDSWLFSKAINKKKLPFYAFLLKNSLLADYVKLNPEAYFTNSVRIIKADLGHLYRISKGASVNEFGIGTHLSLTTKSEKEVFHIGEQGDIKYSEGEDLKYLKKLYYLCKRKKIKLVLISTPLMGSHPTEPLKKYASDNLPLAEFLDLTTFLKDPSLFADSGHVNKWGAEKTSVAVASWLRKK